jgi:ribulose-5-phosphate 4-epimerase/fuculose-1-phosphate aldolase
MNSAATWFVLLTGACLGGPYLLGVRPRTSRQWLSIAITVGFLAWILLFMASLGSQPSPPSRDALVAELVLANRILANEGVLDGYGHVSVRSTESSGRFFLARSIAPALVSGADIVEYDLNSVPVSASSAAGYIERFIHGEIYRVRSDVKAIVHCHCPDVIPFAATAVPLRPLYHMGSFIGEGVPVFDSRAAAGITDMLIRTPELGRALAATLGAKPAVLMRGHGAVIAASSLHLVVGQAYYLNLNARLQLQAMQLAGGKVTYLSPEESKNAAQDYERSWDFWKSRLPRP